MEFTQKDELGLNRTYYVITQMEIDGEKYVIYTDLVKDEKREFRLLVGQIDNGKVIRVDKNKEIIILEYFKQTEQNYKEQIKELI